MNATSAQKHVERRPPCLLVKNLSVRFGELRVFENVGLSVETGERRGVIGPNGAGKTTFFNALAGTVRSTSGSVYLFGEDISRLPAFRRAMRGVSRTFQRTKLFPGLTVIDNLILSMQALSPHRYQPLVPRTRYANLRDRALASLRQFDLESRGERTAASLAYGEQRQVEILMAMVQDPRLLLLDEPTAGLSAAEARIVTEMLAGCNRETTILMIEHDMDVVFGVVDHLTVLHAGSVVADGPVDEVRRNPVVQEAYLGGKL